MDDQPKPMLNSPVVREGTAGEEFASNVLGRLDGARAARESFKEELIGACQADPADIEKWKQGVITRFSELIGLEFDQDGKCITPGKVRMDGEFKEKWAQVVEEFSAQKDSHRAEQLFGEAGRLLRGAAEKP
jgi:hypothetical protein